MSRHIAIAFAAVAVATILVTGAGAGSTVRARSAGSGEPNAADDLWHDQVGGSLTAAVGPWDGKSLNYAYQWLRCDSVGKRAAARSPARPVDYQLPRPPTSAQPYASLSQRRTETALRPPLGRNGGCRFGAKRATPPAAASASASGSDCYVSLHYFTSHDQRDTAAGPDVERLARNLEWDDADERTPTSGSAAIRVAPHAYPSPAQPATASSSGPLMWIHDSRLPDREQLRGLRHGIVGCHRRRHSALGTGSPRNRRGGRGHLSLRRWFRSHTHTVAAPIGISFYCLPHPPELLSLIRPIPPAVITSSTHT